jgi:hypothetical protein
MPHRTDIIDAPFAADLSVMRSSMLGNCRKVIDGYGRRWLTADHGPTTNGGSPVSFSWPGCHVARKAHSGPSGRRASLGNLVQERLCGCRLSRLVHAEGHQSRQPASGAATPRALPLGGCAFECRQNGSHPAVLGHLSAPRRPRWWSAGSLVAAARQVEQHHGGELAGRAVACPAL